jgi:N-acetylglucosamine-6-phosphate deacetylase
MSSTITADRALVEGRWRERVRLDISDGVISAISDLEPEVAPEHVTIAPGFVDLQVNGIDDIDVANADGEDWSHLATALASQGTTTWCPTLTTRPLDSYLPALDRIRAAMSRPLLGPDIAGVHLEGPFLGGAHGAHRSQWVTAIDHQFLRELPDHVRLVTLGAEIDDAAAAIRTLVDRGIVVALGHSTPTGRAVDEAIVAGARLVTHVFNAMSGIHHRDDGLALHALTDDRLLLSMIADGVHVSDRAMSLVWRARPDGVVLVTDSVAWRTPTGRVTIVDGAPRLHDGTLAGSCLTMDAAVRVSVKVGAELRTVLLAASTRPAQLLGLHDRGVINVGQRADLVELDQDLEVSTTWSRGQVIHRR